MKLKNKKNEVKRALPSKFDHEREFIYGGLQQKWI
jgi:hypothetical protein